MKKPWTVQLAYAAYFGATVTVEAETLEQAIPAAIREADDNERWKNTDHAGDPHAVAAARAPTNTRGMDPIRRSPFPTASPSGARRRW